MGKLVLIYVDIISGEIKKKFLYNVVFDATDKIVSDCLQYIEQFNKLINSEDDLQIRFSLAFESRFHRKIKDNEKMLICDFLNQVSTHTDIEPFILGWTKYIVDDIFKMDEIRRHVSYNSWLHVLFYFDNGQAPSPQEVASIYFKLDDELALNNFRDTTRLLVFQYGGPFQFSQNPNLYWAQDLKFRTDPSFEYNRPRTDLSPDFWELILYQATLHQLDLLYHVGDFLLDGYILATKNDRHIKSSLKKISY